jgi:alkylation response protein AidB-like acyl-CoA dehydrogenase
MSITGPAPLSQAKWDLHLSSLRALGEKVTQTPAIDDRCYQLLREMQVFRTLLPRYLQGAEADPLDAMASVEALATVSGTIGWISLVGVTGAIFATELEPAAARQIYADPDAIIAYAGAPNGTLTPRGNHFVLSGHWNLASCLSHATWAAMGCRPSTEPDGGTAVAIVPARDCTTSLAWEPVGLAGTGTGAVSIDQVCVPAEHVIPDGPQNAEGRKRRRHRQLIPSMIASVSLGIAAAVLSEMADQLSTEPAQPSGLRRADSEHVQHLLGRANAELRSARAFLHEVTADTWRRTCVGQDLGLEHGALQRLAATHAATVAAETSATVTTLAGTRAVTASDRLCRRWMDARTITANITVRDLYYRVFGGVATGGQIPSSWP